MAKKIIISFSDQPITSGAGFKYNIQVDGLDITYSNGETECLVEFIPNGDTPTQVYQVPIGVDLTQTLDITKTFLRQNYINYIIDYNVVGSTIEVLVQADVVVTIDPDINDNITITTQDVEPSGENLKYYIVFGSYTLNIYKKNYLGSATEINGTFTLKKSGVDTILSQIRGTGIDLSLEANTALTFDEFLLEPEFTFKVELLRTGVLIYKGYIKPDGCQQSFVNDLWYVNIETVDGLGLLKDLSFVQANGLRFTGMMSIYNVIKGCLDRTRLSMDIMTSVQVEYVGYTGTNILKDVFVNSDRFIKNEADTVIMDCNEVLTSMLNLFSAVITQQDGKWWIYRPNDLALNGYTEFINQTTNTTSLYNLNAVLGSQVNNFYPHHCGANQQIEVKGAISAYRLNYKYGFLDGFLKNTNLDHNTEMAYTDWETNPDLPIIYTEPTFPFASYPILEIVNNPLSTSGLEMIIRDGVPLLTTVLTSSPVDGLQGQSLTFRFKGSTRLVTQWFVFQIKTNDGYYLNSDNQWSTDSSSYFIVQCGTVSQDEYFISYELLMPPLIADCEVTVVICCPLKYTNPFDDTFTKVGTAKISYIQILDNTIKSNGIVGEFHTVSRKNPPSSITKENQTVYNGDGTDILIGSIYKDDLETLTTQWTRKGKFESLPLLGISAMDDLRIQSAPIMKFSGDIFGEIKYMSVVQIDGISGYFMFIDYEYDYKTNIAQVKLLQFYNSDLGDIEYAISPDYGNNTIKPTIKG